MGLKKIDVRKMIVNQKRRTNSFYKRKYGILRKLIQMSQLCNSRIIFYLYNDDLKQLYEYKSDEKFTLRTINAIINGDVQDDESKQDAQMTAKNLKKDFPVIRMTKYDNSDYEILTHKHLPKEQREDKLNQLRDKVEEMQDSDGSISHQENENENCLDIVSEDDGQEVMPDQEQITQKYPNPRLTKQYQEGLSEFKEPKMAKGPVKTEKQPIGNMIGSMNMQIQGTKLQENFILQEEPMKKNHKPIPQDQEDEQIQPSPKRQRLDNAEQFSKQHSMTQNPAQKIGEVEKSDMYYDGFKFDFKKYRDKISQNIIDYKHK